MPYLSQKRRRGRESCSANNYDAFAYGGQGEWEALCWGLAGPTRNEGGGRMMDGAARDQA